MMKRDPAHIWREAIELYDRGQYAPALPLLTQLQSLKPDHLPVLHLLAVCKFRLGETQAALEDLKSVVEKGKDLVSARVDYATLLNEIGDYGASLHALKEAYADYPDNSLIGLNLCIAYGQLGDWAAFDSLSQQLIRQNAAPELVWMRALICLGYQKFDEGWRQYRVRWQLPGDIWNSARHDLGLPSVPEGIAPTKPFWLWTEQGIGDEILLASVLADAQKAGMKFIFGCNPRNIPLFRRRFPELKILDVTTARRADLGDIALQMPLADLTARLRPDAASFANQPPYLRPDAELRDRLRHRYQAQRPGNLLVGVSWHSGKAARAIQKSTALRDWLPILQVPGVTFVNLQYGYTQPELAGMRKEFGIEILHDPSINPLGPTDPAAAQIAAMDMVITVSNTAAHLAGALGIPTLVMLPATYGLQWYWFRDTEQSPWYGSLTLLRQRRGNDWHPVIAEAQARLERFIISRR
jgi:hypothetical protein